MNVIFEIRSERLFHPPLKELLLEVAQRCRYKFRHGKWFLQHQNIKPNPSLNRCRDDKFKAFKNLSSMNDQKRAHAGGTHPFCVFLGPIQRSPSNKKNYWAVLIGRWLTNEKLRSNHLYKTSDITHPTRCSKKMHVVCIYSLLWQGLSHQSLMTLHKKCL